jgi:site-specific DNA-methyltransferase (adenine-specific)
VHQRSAGNPPEAPAFTWSAAGCDLTLHQLDCVAAMPRLLAPGSVDVVVTSPPYNLGTAYAGYDDSVPRADYLDWMEQWAVAVHTVLSPDGSLFLNIGGRPADPWGPFDVLFRLRRHFVLQNTIHWIKSIAIDAGDRPTGDGPQRRLAVGHYKPISSRRYLNDCHEYIFHLTKSGAVELDRLAIGVEYQDKTNIARWKSAGGGRRCRGNTWFIPYQTIRSRQRQRPHPATFPVRLPLMCIQLHGLTRVRRVVDPFLGLGHSALACKALKVPFTGFEVDASYFAAACQQVETVDVEAAVWKRAAQLSLFGRG